MKRLLAIMPAILFLIIVVAGCGEKEQKVFPVNGYSVYNDPDVDFSLKYPSNWYTQKYEGFRFLAYTSKEAAARFRSYASEGVPGAKIEMYVVKLKDGVTYDSVMRSKFYEPWVYSAPKPVTVDGIQGNKQSYKYELNDGIVEGEIYYFAKDSNFASVINFEAFEGTFKSYRKNFDEILSSVKLAVLPEKKSRVDTVVQELPPPSTNLVNVSGDGFSIQIPDNFDSQTATAAGALKGYNYIGERRADGNIRVDIFDASKQSNLDKIVETNKPKYKGANPSGTNIGGKKAYVFDYSPISGVRSRVFFAVSNNRLYRVTMNWPVEEEQSYKPIFEKSIRSIKIQ